MNNVRIGIIGIGNMGSAHARSIFSGLIPRITLTAVCDIAPQKLEWASANLPGTPQFTDYRQLLKSGLIDAVIIATPHYLHPPIAVEAFGHGLHVMTEKPAGVYTAQVQEMNQAAKESGKVFGIMYNQRTNPLFQEMRQMVKSGRLGELKRSVWIITNWYRTQAYYNSGSWRATWEGEGGGVLLNQCPHNLDLWQWIFGMPSKIRGFCQYGRWHNIEVEDEVTAFAQYPNGATGVFITTTGEFPGTNRLEITGDKGKLVWEEGRLTFWELSQPERQVCFESPQGFASIPCSAKQIETNKAETGHIGILKNFANCILDGEELLSPGYEGINGLNISNAIHLSDWTNDWVDLPVDSELFLRLLNQKRKNSVKKETISSEIQDISGTYNDRWKVR